MRIGAKVPNSGPLPATRRIDAMARELDDAGFDSLWCSDHIVMPAEIRSRYPFSDDGRATWDVTTPWYDAVVALTAMAMATRRADVGVAVLVLPLRHPVILAKQVASIDALADGRVVLGVGAGWLAEEFDALNVDYDTRGQRMGEWMALLRACWTGVPKPLAGAHYTLPGGLHHQPVPAHAPPLLVGGMTAPAVRRAARTGDGWLALQRAARLEPGALAGPVTSLRDEAASAGRDPDAVRVVLRIIESAGQSESVAAALPDLARAGVDEVIVDIGWDSEDPRAVHDRLRERLP